ncbi:MAG: hypothetical protein ACD_15C00099G0001 [uncultured bacterium]|nr:MAG: hypothetical protein ACD_15C00099G0001 [uncultured bacterium]HCU70820.1 hypothetical protein [Candidatus Moranbacteria bacterium]
MLILSNLSAQQLLIVIAVLAIFIFFTFFWTILLHKELKKIKQRSFDFFNGNSVKNIEDIIIDHSRIIKTLDKDIQELYNISNQINTLAHKGFHKFAMLRFNPFKEVGGNQSFSLALLNGKNNGLVISSLYTREGTRIYTKAIINGASEKHPLTEEEKEVIKLANSNDSKKIN